MNRVSIYCMCFQISKGPLFSIQYFLYFCLHLQFQKFAYWIIYPSIRRKNTVGTKARIFMEIGSRRNFFLRNLIIGEAENQYNTSGSSSHDTSASLSARIQIAPTGHTEADLRHSFLIMWSLKSSSQPFPLSSSPLFILILSKAQGLLLRLSIMTSR